MLFKDAWEQWEKALKLRIPHFCSRSFHDCLLCQMQALSMAVFGNYLQLWSCLSCQGTSRRPPGQHDSCDALEQEFL
eukprot:1157982-Pelagomonas_calceolata.AAC.10